MSRELGLVSREHVGCTRLLEDGHEHKAERSVRTYNGRVSTDTGTPSVRLDATEDVHGHTRCVRLPVDLKVVYGYGGQRLTGRDGRELPKRIINGSLRSDRTGLVS